MLAWLRALRAYVFKCQRALRAYVLTCQSALCCYELTCRRALRAQVLTCQRALRTYVPTCLACSCAHVPTCLACSRTNVSCVSTCSRNHVLTCQRALRALRAYVLTYYNYKWQREVFNNMFSLHFCDCSLSFSFEIKTVVHSCISLTSQKPLMGAMTNFLQWNGLIFVWA